MLEQNLTVKEVAYYLNVSDKKVYKLFDSGELGYTAIGRRKTVPKNELEDFIKRNTKTAKNREIH